MAATKGEQFAGVTVALITPFRNGQVDFDQLRRLVDWHVEQGTDCLAPVGTTGESPTLDHEEHGRVVASVCERAAGRLKVIAGTGSNSTAEAIRMTKAAKAAGADGTLQVGPYYNKPTQEGLYRHYKVIAESVDLPQILYNIPGRTGVNMLPSTVARLCGLQSIVGIKEGSGSVLQASEIAHMCGDRITVLAGDDALTLPMMAVGGKGVISVTSNVAPSEMAQLVKAFLSGRIDEARRIHFALSPLFNALFYETNPIPVKTALGMMGKIDPELRLPLCAMATDTRDQLTRALKDAGLV